MVKTALPLAVLIALAPVQLVRAQTSAPAPAAATPPPCLPDAQTRYVCNVQVVEDMALVPGGRWVVGSAMAAGAGGLYLIDTRTLTATCRRSPWARPRRPMTAAPGRRT